jgi:hypothetical protein
VLIATAVAVAVAVAAVLALTTPWSTSGATTADGGPGSAPEAPTTGPKDAQAPTVDPAALVAAVPA